jgi:NADH-quinone oxidoreductase subunit N
MLMILAVLSMAHRQPGRHRADQPQAHAGLLDHLAHGLHAARLLSGIVVGDRLRRRTPTASAMFYAITYVLMSLGTFGMILLLSRAGFEAENHRRFQGPEPRSPWFAFMLILMFSMAGMPPTASTPSWRCCRRWSRRAGLAGGVRRGVLAGRRVLLPARGQGDVLRRADMPAG